MTNVRVPITNLFSGVARQPAGKRLTSELEEVDNAILTLERSAEKRPPTEFIDGGEGDGSLAVMGSTIDQSTDDVAYFFFDKTDTERYLIIVDRSVASDSVTPEDLIKVIKIKEHEGGDDYSNPYVIHTGDAILDTATQVISYTKVNQTGTSGAHDYKDYIEHDYYKPYSGYPGRVDDIWEYVAFNPSNKPAREILKATFFGNALVILNSEVPATTWTTAITEENGFPDVGSGGAGQEATHPRSRKLDYRVAAVPGSLGHSNMGSSYDLGEEEMVPVGGCHCTHEMTNMSGADGSGQVILATMYVNNLTQSAFGVGTVDMSLINLPNNPTLFNICDKLNSYAVPVANPVGQTMPMSSFGTFKMKNIDYSQDPPVESFSLSTNVDTTGQLCFLVNSGSDIVQWYDQYGGTTAQTLGITGSTGTFDGAQKEGKNLKPFVASTDSSTGSTAKSWGGGQTGGDIKFIMADGSSYVATIPTWANTTTFSAMKAAFETAADFSGTGGPEMTLKLNSAKTGFYPVDESGVLPEEIIGDDPDGVVMSNKYGWTYSASMHKTVRDDIVEIGDVIEVEIGQNISSFEAIELPPQGDDVNRTNAEEDAIASLYEDGNVNGYGKVWYCRKGFLTFPAGFYRCTSNTVIPHYNQVRCEEEHSVWYEPSFPFMLLNTGEDTWSVEYPKWNPRETGTLSNNPGPQAFKDGKKSVISDICFWRERLFFATEDMVFSSRNNDWFNLWLNNPDNITSDDPIDIRASSGKFTRISFMIPFNDFLFINTGGETQYELQGSNNVISPTTAELAPTSFYSSSQIVEPLVLGTQIYWFDRERLYLYNSSAGSSVNNATEVSIHAHGYLPEKVRCAVVAAAQDSIYAVDDAEPNKIYVYTARWSGGEIVQNSFYRYIMPQTIVPYQLEGTEWDTTAYWDSETGLTTLPPPEVEYLWYVGNYLYMIIIRPCGDGKMKRFIERTALMFHDINIPRVDRQVEINNLLTVYNLSDFINFDGVSETTVKLPYWDPSIDKAIPGTSWVTDAGMALEAVNHIDNYGNDPTDNTELLIQGNWDYEDAADGPLYMRTGSNYTMKLEMSRVVYRDPSTQLPIDGTLNLKMMNIQHFKTGVYDVEITRNNRVNPDTGTTPSTVVTHTPLQINNSEDALGALLIEGEGEFTTKIMGFSDTTTIAITSDYTTPVAIASLDFTGMFKATNSSISP